ncbi:MAG: antibiotic biosynthesis monooxygenase family protein [Planctomycetaceae bacterium]
MFCLNVVLTVQDPDNIAKVASLLTECGRRSREEPGCISYEACHSRTEPTLFILCERWESEAAWMLHKEGRVVQEIYLPQVIPLVSRTAHPSDLLV